MADNFLMKMKMELSREVTQQAKRFGKTNWQHPREIVGVKTS
jgi:hypothetical protein